MRGLITGAGGLIGRGLIDELLKDGIEVYTLGRNKIDEAHKHFGWTLGMSPNPESFEGVDWIIHLAWDSSSRKSGSYHINIGGASLLIESAKLAEIPVIVVSSFATFNPISEYGKAKTAIEQINSCGINLRVGKIERQKPDKLPINTLLRFIPLLPCPKEVTVHVAFLDEFLTSTRAFLFSPLKPGIIVSPSHEFTMKSYLKQFYGIQSIELPAKFFHIFFAGINSLKIPILKAFSDKWKSVYSTSQELKKLSL